MGFLDRLLGREGTDNTVTDFQAATERARIATSAPQQAAAASSDTQFRLVVEDVFTITGRGTVITGTIATGTVSVGDRVSIANAGVAAISCTVSGVEMFRKRVTTAGAGDMVGLLLDGVRRQDVTRGAVITVAA